MFSWYKKVVFENYSNFKGRARRSEFWYFTLVSAIFSLIPVIINELFGFRTIGIIGLLYSLLTFIPSLAVSVRRLHDIGKSGWLLLISYLLIAVSLISLVVFSSIYKHT